MISKQQYQKLLEKLFKFETPNLNIEQYYTTPDVAGQIITAACLSGDIEGKVVVDLGCGTGFLGIGALINNAKMVYFLDLDENALKTLAKNIKYIEQNYDIKLSNYKIIRTDIRNVTKDTFEEKIDTVIMNPPFGNRARNIDVVFLEKAFDISMNIYLIYLRLKSHRVYIPSQKKGYSVEKLDVKYTLKKQYAMHKEDSKDIDVSIFVLKCKNSNMKF